MIDRNEYLKAKQIVEKFENEQLVNNGYAIISLEGDFVAKVKESELKDWLDKFFSEKLKNKPKKYSQKMWDNLKSYRVYLDGEDYSAPYFDEELCEKWF